jgi:hypothetical protein
MKNMAYQWCAAAQKLFNREASSFASHNVINRTLIATPVYKNKLNQPVKSTPPTTPRSSASHDFHYSSCERQVGCWRVGAAVTEISNSQTSIADGSKFPVADGKRQFVSYAVGDDRYATAFGGLAWENLNLDRFGRSS